MQDTIPTPPMRCDHTTFRCLAEVRRAPIIIIPARAPADTIYKPVRIPTPLHYCEGHRGDFDVTTYLSAYQKSRIEAACRLARPDHFRPDFEAAFVDLVLVTTPEYRRFLVHIGVVQARRHV